MIRSPSSRLAGSLAILAGLAALAACGTRAAREPSSGGASGAAQTGSTAGSTDQAGFVSIFDGASLEGWEGDPRIWSVEDGAIVGRTTEDVRVSENDFLVWKGGEPESFELLARFRLEGGNSGIYFHAERRPPGAKGEPLVGPQADLSADHRWTGVLMEYTKREILAERGQKVAIDPEGRKEVIGSLGDPAKLLEAVRDGEWNDYRVLVDGTRTLLEINGVPMCEVVDRDPRRTPRGLLALQVHTGPPMTVRYKELRLRALGGR